jgi:hypothetical protein
MKALKAIVGALAVLIVSALTAEFTGRWIFGLQPLMYGYPYHPLLVSGDYYYLVSNDGLAAGPGGPTALGYEADRWSYRYRATTPPPRSSTDFTDFLFSHNRARYPAKTVDELACRDDKTSLVYVLGGSVAQGFSASAKETTWHALVEKALRQRTASEDLYVVNAAMGGYVSLQEKLAYYLAVVPRDGRTVLVVNGYNELLIPASSGIRPGDPIHLAIRYGQVFGNGFVWWAAKHSGIVNRLLQDEIIGNAMAYRRDLNERDDLFNIYAEAVTGIYIENMSELLADCAAHKRACLIGIQPARSVSAARAGVVIDDVLSQRRVVQLYERLLAKVAASPHRDRFVDLTRVLDGAEALKFYADGVHPDDRGQNLLADALIERTAEELKASTRSAVRSPRCR